MKSFRLDMVRIVLIICLLTASCGHRKTGPVPLPQIPSPEPTVERPEEVSHDTIRAQAAALEDQLIRILREQGSQQLARYLRLRANEGLDLRPLRSYFFEKNGGAPEVIDVFIRPRSEPLIDFANEQLARSGVDFIRFNGIVDRTLPSVEEPLPEHEELYRKWQISRSASMPLIGFAVTLVEARRGLPRDDLIASLVRAFSIFGIELQFTVFSAQWNRLWTQDQSLISWRMDVENARFRRLAELLNGLLDSTRGLTVSHVNVYLVSWAYTLILYAVGHMAYRIVAPGTHSFNVMKVVAESWVVNTGIFLAYGMAQVGLGQSFKRGEISETMRFQLETIVGGWVAFWRAVSIVPQMKVIGRLMLYSFGAVLTTPFLFKNYGAESYAKETAAKFAENEGLYTPLSAIERQLSRSYDWVTFSKDETLGDLLKELREKVQQALMSSELH